MTKMGRPTKTVQREKLLSIRVTDKEQENLKEYALRHNQTISQAVLTAIELLYLKEAAEK